MRDDNRKRVLCACDSCRVKKTKCDGNKPCTRCVHDGQLCTFSHRKKQPGRVFTAEYVELLEAKVHVLLSSLTTLVELVGQGSDCREHIDGPDTPINKVIESLERTRGGSRRNKAPRFDSPSKHDSDASSVATEPHTPACDRLPITPPTLSPEDPIDVGQQYSQTQSAEARSVKSESPNSNDGKALLGHLAGSSAGPSPGPLTRPFLGPSTRPVAEPSAGFSGVLSGGPSGGTSAGPAAGSSAGPAGPAGPAGSSAGPSALRAPFQTAERPVSKKARVEGYVPQHTVKLEDIELSGDGQIELDNAASSGQPKPLGKAESFWEAPQQRRPSDSQAILLEGFEQPDPGFYDILDDGVPEPLEAVDLCEDLYFHPTAGTTCMR